MYDLRDFHGPLRIAGIVVCCRGCGMWFKIPEQSESAEQAYGSDYAEDPAIAEYMMGDYARAFFRRTLLESGITGSNGKPTLLDIGTGRGAMLEEAGKLGFEAEGIELCAPLAEAGRARGLNVRCMPAEALESGRLFDAVTLMDIIEHVQDPVSLLASARRVLKPGGKLIVYTPNHRAAVVMLARWLYRLGVQSPVRHIFGCTHVCFFDDLSLPACLNKAGFAIRRTRSFPYEISRPGEDVPTVSLAVIGAAEGIGWLFGRVFRLLVYAEKS